MSGMKEDSRKMKHSNKLTKRDAIYLLFLIGTLIVIITREIMFQIKPVFVVIDFIVAVIIIIMILFICNKYKC